MSEDQYNRHQDGRFAETVHGETSVQLYDRTDGTFFYPSPFSNAESCVAFWNTVDVPDEIVDQLVNAYRARHQAQVATDDAEIDRLMLAWADEWMAANPEPGRWTPKEEKVAHRERYEADFNAHRAEIEPQVRTSRASRISAYDGRQLVRVLKMEAYRPNPDRYPEESLAVLDKHPVELYDETLTVRQIEQKYGLLELHGVTMKINPVTDQGVVDMLDLLNDRLMNANDALVAIRQNTTQTQY
ncbi:hypothetical protein V6N00_12950 [Tersicoccus sp. MR15.9]|uniref:hypothetical protein n=1 Tax=Tersicoccus mangrovi TaxID=3121635 RepID=UPI002FE657B6